MNTGGVIKGGLLAGLVINIGEFVLNGVLVADTWAGVLEMIGASQTGLDLATYVVFGFLIGIAGVWIYAAVRPRLGPGPVTAVKVGLVVWFFAYLWQDVSFMTLNLFPEDLLLLSAFWTLIETPVAIAAGAWLCTEVETPT